jgi:hypothetical protein
MAPVESTTTLSTAEGVAFVDDLEAKTRELAKRVLDAVAANDAARAAALELWELNKREWWTELPAAPVSEALQHGVRIADAITHILHDTDANYVLAEDAREMRLTVELGAKIMRERLVAQGRRDVERSDA